MLRRAAFSPNIKERADCSAALFTADGELLVQAEHIPVHLGSMPASVRAAIDAFGGDARAGRPGGRSTTRSPAAPTSTTSRWWRRASSDGRLVGWAANRAHHADVGGAAPGSIPADATEIHQEGLRIPPTLLDDGLAAAAAGQLPHARTSGPGDLDAQVGRQRRRRRAAGRDRWPARRSPRSSTTASAACGRALAACPTARGGSPTSSTRPGPRPTSSARPGSPWPSRWRATRSRSTSPAPTRSARGNVNAVEAVTVSAVSLRPAVGASTRRSRPTAAPCARSGSSRPPGTVVAARPPAAVGAGNVEVSQRVADVCLGALAGPCPARVAGRRPGDDEQRAHRRATAGSTTRRSPAGRAAGPTARRA